jgi:hypothetical protein
MPDIGQSLLNAVLPAWPPYRRMVADEAAYLAEALGPRARRYAREAAEDLLSPLHASFMRRVSRRIRRDAGA